MDGFSEAGLYEVIPLKEFRNTPGVRFHMVDMGRFMRIDAMDRVEHGGGARSPGPVETPAGTCERPWYYHKAQTDNLIVFTGHRVTELYTPKHGRIETFDVTSVGVSLNGEVIFDGPAFLSWPPGVFHRVSSGPEGSLSVNMAVHHAGFSLEDNFDIYEVDIATGEARLVRRGFLDQR
jgi:hypothetical protein